MDSKYDKINKSKFPKLNSQNNIPEISQPFSQHRPPGFRRRYDSIKFLIDLGTLGIFPLFYPQWIDDSMRSEKHAPLKLEEKVQFNKILDILEKHQSHNRKKEYLSSLDQSTLKLFIHAFMKLVETKIIDKGVSLH
jgi:hypothetical protein